ncbi:MAG: hypothetical protein M1816_007284 [Peltula sp. TS41687]|nr:MAG: hypothetical protein M1816_007284 [Peltula sp. TS41687]
MQIETPLNVGALDNAFQSFQPELLAPLSEPNILPEYNTDEDLSMPPPMDEEEENEESRVLEALARKKLENEGCPPYYPADLEFPLIGYSSVDARQFDILTDGDISAVLRKRSVDGALKDESQYVSIVQGRLDYAERRRDGHDILQQWNEQQRIAMDAQYWSLMRGDDSNALKAARKPSDSGRRKRQPRTRAVLRKAGVSKPKQVPFCRGCSAP